jgi:hypothetical protein
MKSIYDLVGFQMAEGQSVHLLPKRLTLKQSASYSRSRASGLNELRHGAHKAPLSMIRASWSRRRKSDPANIWWRRKVSHWRDIKRVHCEANSAQRQRKVRPMEK